MSAEFIKPLHSSTKTENLVKIRPVVPEISLLIGRPLKISLKKKKTSAKYIG